MSADLFASVRGPIEPRPFPFAPLQTIAGLSLNQLALRLGTRQSTLSRCVLAGCTDEQADRWAVALGYHPSEVWPEWYPETPEDEHESTGCGTSDPQADESYNAVIRGSEPFPYMGDPGAATNSPGSGRPLEGRHAER